MKINNWPGWVRGGVIFLAFYIVFGWASFFAFTKICRTLICLKIASVSLTILTFPLFIFVYFTKAVVLTDDMFKPEFIVLGFITYFAIGAIFGFFLYLIKIKIKKMLSVI